MDQDEFPCIMCDEKSITYHSANRTYCSKCKKRYSYKKAVLEARVVEYFGFSIPALTVSRMINKNYKTVHRIYHCLQKKILDFTLQQATQLVQTNFKYQQSLFSNARKTKGLDIKNQIELVMVEKSNYVFFLLSNSINPFAGIANKANIVYRCNLYMLKDFGDFSFMRKTHKSLWNYIQKRRALFRGIESYNMLLYLKSTEFFHNLRGQNPQKHLKSIWFFGN